MWRSSEEDPLCPPPIEESDPPVVSPRLKTHSSRSPVTRGSRACMTLCHVRTERPVYELARDSENEQIRQKRADSRWLWRRDCGIVESQWGEIYRAIAGTNNFDEINNFFIHNYWNNIEKCRCSMTSHGDLQTMNGNALLTPYLWLYLQKFFQQDVGHFSHLHR